MTATDDYPSIARWGSTQVGAPVHEAECRAILAEVDRLREANRLLNDIAEDVLPRIVITEQSIFRIDGRWMLVTPNPKDLT
jgi:hypothetical protein